MSTARFGAHDGPVDTDDGPGIGAGGYFAAEVVVSIAVTWAAALVPAPVVGRRLLG